MPSPLYVVSRSLPSLLVATLACGRNEAPPESTPSPGAVVVAPPAAPAGSGASGRLYASGVALSTLPLSIGIETVGGVASVMLPRGTPLPTTHTEIFSTATDNQASVEVAVTQGERPFAADDRMIGKFQLVGIPPAPRGVPQVQVTFSVDAAGILSVSAFDLASKQTRGVRIDGAFGTALDQVAVDRTLAEAAAARGGDDARRAVSEAKRKLRAAIGDTRELLDESLGRASPELQTRVRASLLRAQSAETEDPTSAASVDAALADLQSVTYALATVMFERAAPLRDAARGR